MASPALLCKRFCGDACSLRRLLRDENVFVDIHSADSIAQYCVRYPWVVMDSSEGGKRCTHRILDMTYEQHLC